MAEQEKWQKQAGILKQLLNLDNSPVGISCVKAEPAYQPQDKARICRGFLDAARGKSVKIDRKNNACFGAAWHLGFLKIDNPRVMGMIKKFVVEGEKLFSSYQALDKLISQMEPVPDNSDNAFLLCPLEKCENEPDLVLFVLNAHQACRLLTLATFTDGVMPRIKIGGPTCRMIVMYPLASNEVNISFYDYTARKMCGVEADKLLVSIPYKKMPQIIQGIDKCTAGRAKLEYPQEFREFLQRRLVNK